MVNPLKHDFFQPKEGRLGSGCIYIYIYDIIQYIKVITVRTLP